MNNKNNYPNTVSKNILKKTINEKIVLVNKFSKSLKELKENFKVLTIENKQLINNNLNGNYYDKLKEIKNNFDWDWDSKIKFNCYYEK